MLQDFDQRFSDIVSDIGHKFDEVWKWVQSKTNQGFVQIYRVFGTKNPQEQKQHRYQDVVDQDATVNDSVQESEASSQGTTTGETSPVTEASPTSTNTTATESATELIPSSDAELKSSSDTSSQDEPISGIASGIESSNHDSSEELKSSDTELAPLCDESLSEQSESGSSQEHIPESESDTESVTATETSDLVPAQEIAEPEIKPAGDFGGVVPAEKIIEDFQPIIIQEAPEPAMEKVKPPSAAHQFEFEDRVIKKAATHSIVYEQQNIIIMFLFFLIIIMAIYFFLLSRTQMHCPTIVIGELNGNLKPTIKK